MKNVFIVCSSGAYEAMFSKAGFKLVYDMAQADIVCFTGGADVSAKLYGEPSHVTTGSDYFRDAQEMVFFKRAQEAGKPCVGVCRGGQFLNVMSGGSMYQDVERHTNSHLITDLETGETVWVSSTHHQMMKPSPEGILVASSHMEGRREWYEGGVLKKDVSEEDIEIVFYPKTNSLCFQPHPEFTHDSFTNMTNYFFGLLERFFVTEEV